MAKLDQAAAYVAACLAEEERATQSKADLAALRPTFGNAKSPRAQVTSTGAVSMNVGNWEREEFVRLCRWGLEVFSE